MNSAQTSISLTLFRAVMSDALRGGMFLYFDNRRVKMEFICFAEYRNVPSAICRHPVTQRCFAIQVDPFTHGLFMGGEVDCGGKVIPIRPLAA